MQYLFDAWEAFIADVRAAPHVLFFSDYDGTLTPIVSHPEQAILSPEARDKLSALAKKPDFSVGIISGRPLAEIKSLVGIEGIYYAGNHGLEIEGPELKFISSEAMQTRMEIKYLAKEMAANLGGIEGVIVEDKWLGLSVHYRLVKPEQEQKVAEIFRQITEVPLKEGKIRVTTGKKVFEVRPPIDWDKGKAVEKIGQKTKARLKLERLLTLYLGDDTTDEDAFRTIHRPEGWSIFVGGENHASKAEYFLNSSSEVMELLSGLVGFSR